MKSVNLSTNIHLFEIHSESHGFQQIVLKIDEKNVIDICKMSNIIQRPTSVSEIYKEELILKCVYQKSISFRPSEIHYGLANEKYRYPMKNKFL